jgi:hypothetical protein
MRLPRLRRRSRNQEQVAPTLAFPYYIDVRGLRGLSASLGIELPTLSERSSDKRLSAQAAGAGAEGRWGESSQHEGHIHLNDLAAQLKQKIAYRDIVDVLGVIPRVHDRGILDIALGHINNMPPDQSPGAFTEQLQSAYDAERNRKIASAKRQELEQVALQNQLVILRGTFEGVLEQDECRYVRLTHLEPLEMVPESPDTPESEFPPEAGESETAAMLMPEEVGIEAVLPANDDFIAAGRERLERGAPFYGRLIGHSASFDSATGVLTCSAYAVWGMPRNRIPG